MNMNDQTTRIPFTVPGVIPGDAPMSTSPFFKWLMAQSTRQPVLTKALQNYLKPHGYDMKKHTITSEEIDHLRCIFDHYGIMWTPVREPVQLNDLLEPSKDSDAFTLRGDPLTRYKPTKALTAALSSIALVYPVISQHYSFEIINGYLFIKYQQIIGSRRIAEIQSV